MYGFIWRHLPGPTWLRVIEALILVVAAVAVLFQVVFPAIVDYVPAFDNTVGTGS